MCTHRRTGGRPRLMAGVLAAVACAGATLGAAAGSAGTGPAGTGKNAATVETVTSGPARTLGEPAAAGDAAVSAVVATSFTAPGARVGVWTRRAGAAAWTKAGYVLPAGFGSSYDAAAAGAPGGPLLVVAGTAPPGGGEGCIPNGSVAIANVESTGKLGPARLVSDQRGTGSFDDRPAVAIGQDGTVWVAWSQGPDSDACQDVGTGDRIKVAVSRDGGRTFGTPVTMPADGGNSAFGARLAPLSGGRVAVSWTERTSGGGQAVLVAVLGPGKRLTGPWRVLTGDALPLILPGASFYDFPAGDIAALPGGSLVVAVPFWQSGRSVLKLAAGPPGGPWRVSVVSPPGGADLLLPALGPLSASEVRLLCAAHTRSGDRLGYDWADLTVTGQGEAAMTTGFTPLTQAPHGPGFFEIGEELSITRTPAGLLTALVVAGAGGAALRTATWPLPAQVAPLAPSAGTGTPASAHASAPGGARRTHAPTAGARPADAWHALVTGLVVAVVVVVVAGVLVTLIWTARRRRARRNWQQRQDRQHRQDWQHQGRHKR